MKLGRAIGDAVQRIPGVSSWIERIRFGLRMDRRTRRDLRGGGPARRYADWVRRVDTPSAAELLQLRTRADSIRRRPTISLLTVVGAADPAALDRTLRSIRAQIYRAWEACIVTTDTPATVLGVLDRHAVEDPRLTVWRLDRDVTAAAARGAALAAARGDHAAMIDAGDVLPPQALAWIAEAIDRNPGVGLVYADEDRIDEGGRRRDPWFKCDCNKELLLTHDAVARPAVYRRQVIHDVGGWRDGFAGAEDHDLALRVVAAVGTHGVVHVPRILYHRGPPGAESAEAITMAAEASRRAVADLLQRQECGAEVEPAPELPDCHRVRHSLPGALPLVSIIICTRDHERLLRAAIRSIVERTLYPRYEIIVVDNGSVEPQAVAHLAELAAQSGVRVLRDDSSFNYSRLNNRAAAVARGEVLCLLNDDVEVLTPDWLGELVSFAVQPDVGAVGARLWYPDGTLQHGGVVVGICRGAGHAHPRLRRGEPGYFGRAVLQQELSAVTAACLVVRAEAFAAVTGLDERLEVAFNDVDFCLRLRRAGYRNVWTPYAELVHHESATRGVDLTPAQRARGERERTLLEARWGRTLLHDPFYNPNLSHTAADFSIDVPQRGQRAA